MTYIRYTTSTKRICRGSVLGSRSFRFGRTCIRALLSKWCLQ